MSCRAWLGAVAVLAAACTAPESGNPAMRCNDSSSCELDQICYRGFCVNDESEQVDPSSAEDAAHVPPAVPDASGHDADVIEGVVRDASQRDTGMPSTDAGPPCLDVCTPTQDGRCRKCVQDAFAAKLEELCGELEEDDDKQVQARNVPLCLALCLGVARMEPTCAARQRCNGSKCGGMP